MGIEFSRLHEGQCLLCGSFGPLTGEHKIKASLLKEEFGNRSTVLAGKDAPRILQSPRSKYAQFNARICKDCNSSRTQPGDRAFDNLHKELKRQRAEGTVVADGHNRPGRLIIPDTKLEVFQYFAKIICCFLAEVGGPRSHSLSKFALGHSDQNPVFLRISWDESYEEILTECGTQGFAQHGGLKFRFDDQVRYVHSIESSLSVGGILYEFWVRLGLVPKLELHLSFPQLVRTARENIV